MNKFETAIADGSTRLSGTYVGPVQSLLGKTALLVYEPGSFTVHAHFLGLSYPAERSTGWQLCNLSDFNGMTKA